VENHARQIVTVKTVIAALDIPPAQRLKLFIVEPALMMPLLNAVILVRLEKMVIAKTERSASSTPPVKTFIHTMTMIAKIRPLMKTPCSVVVTSLMHQLDVTFRVLQGLHQNVRWAKHATRLHVVEAIHSFVVHHGMRQRPIAKLHAHLVLTMIVLRVPSVLDIHRAPSKTPFTVALISMMHPRAV
jgi:hypothetical protein